jgi:ABC-type lipoprotein release transport system permease subunit
VPRWQRASGYRLSAIAAALAGTLIPAWRASRVDPVNALRAD